MPTYIHIYIYIDTYMCVICVFMSWHTHMHMHGCLYTHTIDVIILYKLSKKTKRLCSWILVLNGPYLFELNWVEANPSRSNGGVFWETYPCLVVRDVLQNMCCPWPRRGVSSNTPPLLWDVSYRNVLQNVPFLK